VPYIEKFAQEKGYDCSLEIDAADSNFSLEEAKQFISTLDIPEKFEQRDYQVETFVHCIRKRRTLFISPTASGKSLIIYLILRYLRKRTLIIVPNTTLIHQMCNDFEEYGFNTEQIHKIYSGQEKDVDSPIYISTWQSAYKMPEEWFSKFRLIIGDEAHRFKAKSLTELMVKTGKTPYKFGFTGSLDGTQTNQLVLEGLFGQYKKIVSTSDLIEQGHISQVKVKAIILDHAEEDRKLLKKPKYSEEIDWLVQNPKRNEFIKNLALSLQGNTLVLYRYVEKQGIPLHHTLKNAKANVYLVHGKIESEERETIRKIVNTEQSSITVASVGCFSEGINIPNIHNIIFASPSKSRILIMQMIGRGLRKAENKTVCTIFDIADDLTYKTKKTEHKNHTLLHYGERLKYYISENFPYKQYRVKL
jgi:superfamily II DNA or RNA helicase